MRSYTRDPRTYELLTILSPDVPEEEIPGALDRLSRYVTDAGGTVDETSRESPWGRRRLAYPIRFESRDVRDGYYTLFRLTLPPDRVEEMERELKLNTQLMRYLVTAYTPVPLDPRAIEDAEIAAEDAAAAAYAEAQAEAARLAAAAEAVGTGAAVVAEAPTPETTVTVAEAPAAVAPAAEAPVPAPVTEAAAPVASDGETAATVAEAPTTIAAAPEAPAADAPAPLAPEAAAEEPAAVSPESTTAAAIAPVEAESGETPAAASTSTAETEEG